jgi:putative membrane protein
VTAGFVGMLTWALLAFAATMLAVARHRTTTVRALPA